MILFNWASFSSYFFLIDDFENLENLEIDLLKLFSLLSIWNYLLSSILLKCDYFLLIYSYFFLKNMSIGAFCLGIDTSEGWTEDYYSDYLYWFRSNFAIMDLLSFLYWGGSKLSIIKANIEQLIFYKIKRESINW